ncbi:MAG TPA: MerR family transcriptional regulator [Acidimicrobiia bacterium]|jgi:MerR family transcriptional regulator/heat shock protein HspR|nr:MerR family transcriptional regulator [Acidimicrobiia bacterium]
MERDARALYVISVAAELAGVHPQTLRIYERKGLIEPQRTQGRSRRYSERDIALLRHIQELTQAGVGLSGVERILELEHTLATARARILELEAQLSQAATTTKEAVDAAHKEYRRDLVPVVPGTVVRLRVPPRRDTTLRDREQS